jgi:hypothetical protein
MIPLVLILGTAGFRALGAFGVRRFAAWPAAAAHAMAVMLVLTASAHFVPAAGGEATPLWQRIPEQILYLAVALWVARTVTTTPAKESVYA